MKTNRPLVVIPMGACEPRTVNVLKETGVPISVISPREVQWAFRSSPLGVILCGGGAYSTSSDIPKEVSAAGVPILAIGGSMLSLATRLGATIRLATDDEFDRTSVHIDDADPLFEDMEQSQSVFSNMRYVLATLPDGAKQISTFKSKGIAGFSNIQRLIWGISFLPTADHTPNGFKILENFVTLCMQRVEPKVPEHALVSVD